MDRKDPELHLIALNIVNNMLNYEPLRRKLVEQGYIKKIFEGIDIKTMPEPRLEGLCKIMLTMCFHKDVVATVRDLDMPGMITELMNEKYNSKVRTLANQSISMLTYHSEIGPELINRGVIDLAMDPCLTGQEEISVMQFST